MSLEEVSTATIRTPRRTNLTWTSLLDRRTLMLKSTRDHQDQREKGLRVETMAPKTNGMEDTIVSAMKAILRGTTPKTI